MYLLDCFFFFIKKRKEYWFVRTKEKLDWNWSWISVGEMYLNVRFQSFLSNFDTKRKQRIIGTF